MRIFTDDGDAIPVTVLDVSNNRVTQVKTTATTATTRCKSRSAPARRAASTSAAGHLAKAGVEAGEILKEFASPQKSQASTRGRCAARERVRHRPEGRRAGTSIGKGFAARSSATTSSRSARRTATAVRTTCRLDLDGTGPGSRVPARR